MHRQHVGETVLLFPAPPRIWPVSQPNNQETFSLYVEPLIEIFWVALGVGYEKGVMIFCDTCFFRSTAFKNDIFIQISCSQRKASAEKRSLMPGLLPTWSEFASEAGSRSADPAQRCPAAFTRTLLICLMVRCHTALTCGRQKARMLQVWSAATFSHLVQGTLEKLQIVGRDVSSRWSLTVPVEGAFNLLEFRLKRNVPLNEWVSLK